MHCFGFSDVKRMLSSFSTAFFGGEISCCHGIGASADELPHLVELALTGSVFSGCIRDVADRTVNSFFDAGRMLEDDARFIYESDPAAGSVDEVIFAYTCFFSIVCYRLAHELYSVGAILSARLIAEYAHSCTGVDIHPGAVICSPFCIDHGTGVVIGETAYIGREVRIYQGVTIGALNFPRGSDGVALKGRKRHPTVLDKCTVYANSSILGGATVIGEGCVIGAGSFVIESLPRGTRLGHSDLRK